MTDWADPLVRKFMVQTEVDEATGCWQWLGYIKENGYGQFRHPETPLAHRAAWLMMRGPIPGDLVIDHHCRNRACVNPDHLEPVPQFINVHRGRRVDWTTCETYHPEAEPRWAVMKTGRRYCRECNRVRAQQHRAARRS